MTVEKYVDQDILTKYELFDYGHALEILHESFHKEWVEIQEALRKLTLTVADISKAGGMNRRFQKSLMMFYIPTDGGRFGFQAT